MRRIAQPVFTLVLLFLFPTLALAQGGEAPLNLHMTGSLLAMIAPIVFIAAYVLVMSEEFIHLRKSKPVVMAAGVIWVLIAVICQMKGLPHAAEQAVRHNLLEYSELFMFLLVAMTYVITMEERLVFESLRSWLVRKGFSYRQLFWITGVLAFFISPIADNLTTALLMCAVVLAVGADSPRFVSLACINIVVAANAGGAFSPFGDITTLMVWQKGILPFQDFFKIFIPSVVSFVIPAAIMHFAIPNVKPAPSDEVIKMKYGAKMVIGLFLLTIATAVSFHSFLHLPPVLGMMTGLGYLQFFAYYLKKVGYRKESAAIEAGASDIMDSTDAPEAVAEHQPFDIFRKIKQAEWDTLLFFYGIILCVGGLSTLGYLSLASDIMYHQWGANLASGYQATPANIVVGFLSAIVDNIPVMFAVLTMNPTMSEGQWLLVTLTAGIGGSMLSIGSAAGVALMGQAQGQYTFFSHLKWSWTIMIGYGAACITHLWLNSALF